MPIGTGIFRRPQQSRVYRYPPYRYGDRDHVDSIALSRNIDRSTELIATISPSSTLFFRRSHEPFHEIEMRETATSRTNTSVPTHRLDANKP